MGSCFSKKLIETNFDTTIRYEDYFKNKIFLGLVVSVYDGDTFRASINLNDELVIINIRCKGYDAPEMKPPIDQPRRELEIRKAIDAKSIFERHLIRNQNHYIDRFVFIHISGFDKYGRFLADVYIPNNNISETCCGFYLYNNINEIPKNTVHMNEWMVKNGYGKEYDGGKKESHV